MAKWVAQRECARELGCAPSYISKLIKNKGLRTNHKKQVDLDHARSIMEGREDAKQVNGARAEVKGAKDKSETRSLTDERAELTRVKREREEIALAKERGEVVSFQAVELVMAEVLTSLRTQMEGLPAKVSKDLAAMSDLMEIRDYLASQVAEVLAKASLYDLDRLFSKLFGEAESNLGEDA
ncbi:MAG: hypothetical protein R6W92_08980 [Desulfocurvibacter africanus]